MSMTKKLLGFIVSVLAISGLVGAYASAETTNSGNAAQGLEISPALVELNAARGNVYDIKLNVTNVTASDLQYDSSVADFGATNETGSPRILTDSKLPATSSIKTWVKMPSNFTLGAHKSKTIMAQVTIPANAEPGGHYGVLQFSGKAPEIDTTGVGLSASAGALVLIRVDGKITEKANLVEFKTVQNDKQSFLFEASPISFVARIKNEGNIHVKPNGSIKINDMFGNLVKELKINKDMANILPDSIRRFDAKLNKDWMIGRYTAELSMGYGTTGQAITNTISFWVIPYKIILAAILIIATIIFIFTRIVKSYTKRVIARAKHEDSHGTHHSHKKH